MNINGIIQLVNIIPKWKYLNIINHLKYYSTDNKDKKEEIKDVKILENIDYSIGETKQLYLNIIQSRYNQIIEGKNLHLDIFSKLFIRFNEDLINVEKLDVFLNNLVKVINEMPEFKDIDKSLIDTILLHIRVNLVYGLFIQWVSKQTNKEWSKKKSLVLELAKSALSELGIKEKNINNLLDILTDWDMVIDLNKIKWIIKVGVNKKDIIELEYSEIEKIVIKNHKEGKLDKLEHKLGYLKVLGGYRLLFNRSEQVFISMCTDLFSVPELGWKDNLKRKLPVKYEVGYNRNNMELFVDNLLLKLNIDSENYSFKLTRIKKKYGGVFKYIMNNNFFFLIYKKWVDILRAELNDNNLNYLNNPVFGDKF